jgi:hypothetical protein
LYIRNKGGSEEGKELNSDIEKKKVFILWIVFKHVVTITIILCVTVDDVFLVA